MSEHKHRWVPSGVYARPVGPGLRGDHVTIRWYECFCGAMKETEQRPGEGEKEICIINREDNDE